jgi:DNA-binding GntR family transcriptional regulator
VRLAVHIDQAFRENSKTQHNSLVEAVREHDPSRAMAVVEEHLMTTRRKLAEIVQASAEPGPVPLARFAPLGGIAHHAE